MCFEYAYRMSSHGVTHTVPVKKETQISCIWEKKANSKLSFRGETVRKRGNFSAFRGDFLQCFFAKNDHFNLGYG